MSKEFLEYLSLYDILSEKELDILHPLVEEIQYQAQQTIFEQGERAKYLYLLVEGEVVIRFNPEDGEALTVATICQGNIFGWSSIFGSLTYTSGAVSMQKGRLLRIKGEDLKNLCEKHPKTGILILDRIASVIASRLKGTQDHVAALLHQGLQNKQYQETKL